MLCVLRRMHDKRASIVFEFDEGFMVGDRSTDLDQDWPHCLFKGLAGEFFINLKAKMFLPKSDYRLFKNVVLSTDDGTTQIDHVIISRYGVFVVETKNMKGWIFGGSRQKSWTQKIYRHTTKFQNPLHQNYKHLKTLQALLALHDDQIHSVVVFIGDSQFKTDMPPNVTHGHGYINYIKSMRDPVLNQDQVATICDRIAIGRLTPSLSTNFKHVANVKKARTNPPPMSSNNCPKCGAALVTRTAKRGNNVGREFLGCPNFPRCRYTRNF